MEFVNYISNFLFSTNCEIKQEFEKNVINKINSKYLYLELVFIQRLFDLYKDNPFKLYSILILPRQFDIVQDNNRDDFIDDLVFDGVFDCRKCKSNNTSYQEIQTRSGDESSTKFIKCHNCQYQWKSSE
jgi:DNA-directed RNA polymerase subunit M/transcription elongation factor TFIIS